MLQKSLSFVLLSLITGMVAGDEATIPMVSMYDLMGATDDVAYIKCQNQLPFEFEPFPLSLWPTLQPHQGVLDETFIALIPQGLVYSHNQNIVGLVLTEYGFVQQLMWPSSIRFMYRHPRFQIKHDLDVTKIPGRVAVIAQEGKAYAHWMLETLGRLALLEIFGIDYDYLYVALDKAFKKETLSLWGVDLDKVIEPSGDTAYIQADELVVPSLIGRIVPAQGPDPLFCLYTSPEILKYIRHKFLTLSQLQDIDSSQFASRVFISRKKDSSRKMINEDEVFALFEAQGFVRYDLWDLSLLQQITLFHNAEIIVACHGSSLTNMMFCTPGTQVIEIFQQRGDCSFWYLSQQLGLKHHCVKTVDFDKKGGFADTYVSPEIMQDVINSLPCFLGQ